MNTGDRLSLYIGQLQARLRTGTIVRAGAIFALAALIATVVLVFIAHLFVFSPGSIAGARAGLLVALVCAVVFGLAAPLYRLDRSRAASDAERVFPKFEQRLVTFAERGGNDAREPMIELLAAETLHMAADAPPPQVFPRRKLLALAGVGAASLGVLVWMIVAVPGYLGHGAALLWTGSSHTAAPFYDLRVSPGDASVRRNADQVITAEITGLRPRNVRLYARYQSAAKWEQLPMQAPQPGVAGYQFVFDGLPESVEYYVDAGPLQSRHFNLKVVDVPAVKQIRVTYRYPSWTGEANVVEEHGGDLRAVEGTVADLEIATNRPLKDGVLALDDGQQIELASSGDNLYKGAVHMEKDGGYHVAALDSGQQVRISDDFLIEARTADPPDVQIVRPAGDYRASPIEEVTIAVKASDEFGLNDLALHYSVNGGPEKTIGLLRQKGAKDAGGSATLYLEDFKMVPGDLVSLYATAKDAHAVSRTDILFIQAGAFEGESPQPQQSAAQAGAGDSSQISGREKEIIAQTWKAQGDKTSTKDQIAENARFLAAEQATLRDEALSLAGRVEARELTGENQEFKDFQKDIDNAAEAMAPASQKLGQQKWDEALPGEQKALQSLLRAEAAFEQIEAALNNRGQFGAGAGGGRELANLFELELDAEKKQFESGGASDSPDQQAQALDDAQQKLDDLAKRQQDLADQQGAGQQTDQERKQQDALRRDAADLEQRIRQLAQNPSGPRGQTSQAGGSSSSSPAGSSPSGSSGQSSPGDSQGATSTATSSGGQTASGPRLQGALDSLRQAQQSMQRATSQPNSNDARNAANRLREAADQINGLQQERSSQQLDSIAKEVGQISDAMRAQADQASTLFGEGQPGQAEGDSRAQQFQKLADDRKSLAEKAEGLQIQLQQSQRNLARTQPEAAAKLLDALGGMQQSDLVNRLKKSAQDIGQGKDPNAGDGDADISVFLKHVSDQVQQAEQSAQAQGANVENLARLERVRNQMQTVIRSTEPNSKPPIFLSGEDITDPELAARAAQADQDSQDAPTPGQGGIVMGLGGQQGNRNFASGAQDLRGSLRGADATGKDAPQGGAEHGPVALSQADIDRALQDAVRELNALKQGVQGRQSLADINDLLNQMKRLDPGRAGGAALIEELQDQVLATVDRLELQLRRDQQDKQASQVRTGGSMRVPPGYQGPVAEYFRRLSKTEKQNP